MPLRADLLVLRNCRPRYTFARRKPAIMYADEGERRRLRVDCAGKPRLAPQLPVNRPKRSRANRLPERAPEAQNAFRIWRVLVAALRARNELSPQMEIVIMRKLR